MLAWNQRRRPDARPLAGPATWSRKRDLPEPPLPAAEVVPPRREPLRWFDNPDRVIRERHFAVRDEYDWTGLP